MKTILKKLLKIKLLILIALPAIISGYKWAYPLEERLARDVVSFNYVQAKQFTYGSGFRLRYNGKVYIITNKHVCDVSKRIGSPNHAFVENDDRFVVAKILKISKKHDLCAVEAASQAGGLSLAEREASILEKIILIGHPRGLPKVIRKGRVIQHELEICIYYPEGNRCLESTQISATAYPGNSGSPVFNESGEVVGVLFAGSPAYPGEPYIVPYKYLLEFMEGLGAQQ